MVIFNYDIWGLRLRMRKYLFLVLLFLPTLAHASVEWTLKNQINLEASPIAMVSAPDGKNVYILVPGKILVFSQAENRVVDFMPIDRKFDHFTVAGKGKSFLLSSSKDTSLSIFEVKKTLDLSGLPYKGPPDAQVVVAVFSDYQ
ncbi:YncE family protein [Geotalea toluenoxydans]